MLDFFQALRKLSGAWLAVDGDVQEIDLWRAGATPESRSMPCPQWPIELLEALDISGNNNVTIY